MSYDTIHSQLQKVEEQPNNDVLDTPINSSCVSSIEKVSNEMLQ
jgi:hypothetical protein